METTDSAPQVETAASSNNPATAPDTQASGAVEAPSQSQPQGRDAADADLRAFYDGQQPEAKSGETTEEPAHPAAEQPAPEEKPQPEPTPEEQAKAAELEEQSKGRFRLKGADAIIAAIAKEKNCSLADAADLYRGKPAAQPVATIPGIDAAPAAPAKPAALIELEGRVATLTGEIETAEKGEDYLTAEYAKKVRQLAELQGDLRLARYQHEQAEVARQRGEEQSRATATERAQAASREQIVKAYPAIADPKAPLCQAAQAVIAELEASPEGLAVLAGNDAPERILAKALLRVPTAPAPATPKASAPLSSPTPTPQAAPVRRVTPAVGSRSQVGAEQPPSLAAATANATTAKELNALMEEHYGREPLAL